MAESIYKVIELIGTSTKSWEDAAKNAVETASKSLRDLRVAEITKLDLKIENGKAAENQTGDAIGGEERQVDLAQVVGFHQ